MTISTAVTAAATEVQAPEVSAPTSEQDFARAFGPASEVTSSVTTAAVSEVATSQQSSAASTEAASQAQSVAETAAVSRPTREQRVDDKEPEDPTAKAYWNRWKTSTGLIEKERQRASRAESELIVARTVPSAAASATTDPGAEKIAGLRKRYAELMVEGDIDAAVKIEDEIDTLKESRYRSKFLTEAAAITTERIAAQGEDTVIAQVATEAFSLYPTLNHEAEDANQDAILFVQIRTKSYLDQKMSRPEALKKAVQDAAPIFYATQSVAETQAVSVAVSAPVDEGALKAMAPVKTKAAPVRIDQKPKSDGSFSEGWATAKT